MLLGEEGLGFLPDCVVEEEPQKQSWLWIVFDADLSREKTESISWLFTAP